MTTEEKVRKITEWIKYHAVEIAAVAWLAAMIATVLLT